MRLPKRAFTLIELLVVIAIIAILAAILFPVFAKVRENARKIACASNARQLAMGIIQYVQDSDEVLPPTAYTDSGGNSILWPALVQPYVKSKQVQICPDDSSVKFNSYGLNERAFADLTDAGSPPPKILAAFQTPATTIMLGETGTGDDLRTPREDAYKLVSPSDAINDVADARPAARHFEQANLGFMDGHQKSMRLERFYQNQTPPDLWFTP